MKNAAQFWRDLAMSNIEENVDLNIMLEKTLENERTIEEKYKALLNVYQALNYCYKVKSAEVLGLKAELKSLKKS
jgi:predicted nucleotidyltransferase